MQRSLWFRVRSPEEEIKEAGLVLDLDEIARKGSMSPEELLVAKWYGIYNMRQPGSHMARVVVPGGVLTSSQARVLAGLSREYAQGKISITTRQSIQFHWLKCGRLPDFLRALHRAGLSTFHGCGDVNRNVTACPWACCCPYRRFDVMPYVLSTHRAFIRDRELDNLPRKHKISYSGCGAGCAQPLMNDVGMVAVQRRRSDGSAEAGFRVFIGGGHGWKPFVAQELFSFIPVSLAVPVCLAVGRLFRDHGDRWNRATSRLKFVVLRKGIETCRDIVVADLIEQGVSRHLLETGTVEDCGEAWPQRPLANPDPRGADGTCIVRAMVPKGQVPFHAFEQVAELSEMYGDKRLHTTNRQNIELHGVRPAQRMIVKSAIEGLGFRTTGFFEVGDIVTCVGTTYCPLAVSNTHELFDLLQGHLARRDYRTIRDALLINITGCPNACSPYRIADLGFRGARLRTQLGSVEGYEICIGGTQERHGVSLGEFRLEDCVRVTEAILDTFAKLRDGSETLSAQVARLGTGPYRAAIEGLHIRYQTAPPLAEFSVFTGRGSTRLDQRTYDRDVPCETACPAKTRVPQYIERIANGDLDGAYRINQEDNVFPGVLGRVCSRPCEPACRHNWTGTEGPVRICHLKRYAADGKSFAPAPLPPWFEASGKRVAIVGSGPSGLTAARELKRYGHDVTLFEAENVLGGMMRLAIPPFRLPRDVLDAEIAAVIHSGIEVRSGEWIGRERVIDLLTEYDAVVLAAGAIKPAELNLPGLSSGVAVAGVRFMKEFNLSRARVPQAPVIVIGGGYTAVDCARAARRLLGAEGGKVKLMYRRTEAHMSAGPHELEEMRREGIDIETLVSPVSVKMEGGTPKAVRFQRMRLVGFDHTEGKPTIEPVAGSEFEEPCGSLVVAIGQTRVIEIFPENCEVQGMRTSIDGLFVAGDARYGSLDVIHAVADGKAVADEIDLYLVGRPRREKVIEIALLESGWTGRVHDMDLVPPPPMPTLGLESRTAHGEVELGFGEEAAHFNAVRCYLCNYKYEIDQDKCIHCDWCIKVMPRNCIRQVRRIFHDEDDAVVDFVEADLPRDATYIWIASDQCIRCGACLRACPTEAITCRRADPVVLTSC